jgi:hypothetical protein
MQSMEIASWSDFKSLVASKKLLMQYSVGANSYDIFAPEANVLLWHVTVVSGTADYEDFEDNFMPTANAPLEIKAGTARVHRVSNSPQPNNTTERWKGYEIACGAEDSSASLDISFGTLIYLRGGMIYSKDVANGDKVKVEIQMQINSVWTTIMTPMEDLFLVNGMRVEVLSSECMEFATTLRLKITFTPVSTGTAKKVYFLLDYYA